MKQTSFILINRSVCIFAPLGFVNMAGVKAPVPVCFVHLLPSSVLAAQTALKINIRQNGLRLEDNPVVIHAHIRSANLFSEICHVVR